MHNKDSENSEPEQIKEYINCFNFAYLFTQIYLFNFNLFTCFLILKYAKFIRQRRAKF